MIAALGGGDNSTADQWMDLDAFRAYHPDKPARATVHEWVSLKKVPVHKDGNGKRLRFLKSEIDEWLTKGRQKTQDRGYDAELLVPEDDDISLKACQQLVSAPRQAECDPCQHPRECLRKRLRMDAAKQAIVDLHVEGIIEYISQ